MDGFPFQSFEEMDYQKPKNRTGMSRFSQTLPSEVTLGSSDHAQLRQSPFPFQSPPNPNLTFSLTLASPETKRSASKSCHWAASIQSRKTNISVYSIQTCSWDRENRLDFLYVKTCNWTSVINQLNLTLCTINRLSAPIDRVFGFH